MTDVDTNAIRDRWGLCGACDAGLLTSCTCPPADPRTVIGNLCDEIDRLRELLDVATEELIEITDYVDGSFAEANENYRRAKEAEIKFESARVAWSRASAFGNKMAKKLDRVAEIRNWMGAHNDGAEYDLVILMLNDVLQGLEE